jgi:hyperosmotically inducible protein
MKHPLKFTLVVSAFALLAQVASAQSASTSTAPDNTKNNKMMSASASADAQKNDPTDLGLTKQIRQSVVADKALSTDAHNVKIVAVNGTVTLNGVVRSAEEKSSIEMKAVSIAGKDRVVNDIRVATSK